MQFLFGQYVKHPKKKTGNNQNGTTLESLGTHMLNPCLSKWGGSWNEALACWEVFGNEGTPKSEQNLGQARQA